MSVLPPLADQYIVQLENLIEKFIWNGKKPKIPLKVLQLHKFRGGVGLANFRIKDDSLKASWVPRLHNDKMIAEICYSKLHYELLEDVWVCNLRSTDVKKLVTGLLLGRCLICVD